MNRVPHSSWAAVYDLAYARSFGQVYAKLTQATLEVIQSRIDPGARIVDFGAGTGRLSIPLADLDFEVVAVDPSPEMLDQLTQKRGGGANLRTVCSTMQDFQERNFDFALCVFTVLLYLLDEDALKKAIAAAHDALKIGGRLLVDIPSIAVFQGYSKRDDFIERTVSVTKEDGDLYRYREDVTVMAPGGDASRYSDDFMIRHWSAETVRKLLTANGFVLDADLSDHFAFTGSLYWIMRKADPDGPPDGDGAARQGRR